MLPYIWEEPPSKISRSLLPIALQRKISPATRKAKEQSRSYHHRRKIRTICSDTADQASTAESNPIYCRIRFFIMYPSLPIFFDEAYIENMPVK